MNIPALTNRLTTSLAAAVTAGEVTLPAEMSELVGRNLLPVIGAAEQTTLAHAASIAWSNEVARAVKAGGPTDSSKVG